MRRLLLIPVALLALGPDSARAQTAESATRARLTTLLTATSGTPQGKGLVETALDEARIAMSQAVQAAVAGEDLPVLQASARGVIHAVDPERVASGPGLGYGVTRAVHDLMTQVELTAAGDSKADVARAAPRALAAAQRTLQSLEALLSVADEIRTATSASEAAGRTRELARLAQEVIAGTRPTAAERERLGPGEGGLLAVRRALAALVVGRDGVLPASIRQVGR